MSFGVSVLMYTGAMTAIPSSVFEAAQLDGINPLKEFVLIVLPQIIPTVSVFIVTGLASVFTNQLHLYSFYYNGAPSEVQTIGYYLYKNIQTAKTYAEYPYTAALGLIITFIVAPLVLLMRWGLKKIDPMED